MPKFLKVILIIALILVGLALIAGVGLFFALKNIDANKLKPQIVGQIQEALGRTTTIGDLKIGITFAQGLAVSVSDVSVADDAAFSAKPFISAAQLSLGVDLVGMIVKRQVNVSGVEIISPQISLIRNSEGIFNYESLAVLQGNAASAPATETSSIVAAGAAALLVKNITLREGVLNFEDHLDEDKALHITKIDLNIADLSLVRPFTMQLRAALLSEAQNVKATSTASIDIVHAAGILKDLRAEIDLGSVDVKAVNGFIPTLTQARLQNPLKGSFACVADKITLSAQGVAIQKIDAKLTGGELRTAYLKIPLQAIEAQMQIVGTDLAIEQATGKLGQGQVNFKGTIKDYLAVQDYHFMVDVSNLNLAESVNQGQQDVTLEGLMSTESTIQGQGFEKLAALDFTNGQVKLRFQEGTLRNINVLRIVLDKLSMLPDLSEKLAQNLPQTYRSQLEQNDTNIRMIEFDMDIQAGQFLIRSAKAQTDAFSLLGQGSLDFHFNMNLVTRITVPKDLSTSMVTVVKELRFITDKDGVIVIPLNIAGKAPGRLSYMPDLQYLGRQFFEGSGRSELDRLIDKALGGSSSAEDQEGSSQGTNNPAKEIIGSVLDTLFRK